MPGTKLSVDMSCTTQAVAAVAEERVQCPLLMVVGNDDFWPMAAMLAHAAMGPVVDIAHVKSGRGLPRLALSYVGGKSS
jgi:hypothetical protein